MFGRYETKTRIEEGAVFKYVHDGSNCTELAEVMSIRDNRFGIPHVHFRMSYRIAERAEEQGMRTLSVSAFSQHFRQLDGAPKGLIAEPIAAEPAAREILTSEGVAA